MSGNRFRKSRRAELSQHFLRSRALASSLVEQAGFGPRDLVIEIGAGRGILTSELARRCGRVVAIELDPELCDGLRSDFASERNVSVVYSDVLSYALPRDRPFKVFGNIPYNASASIVRRLTEARPRPLDVHLVMQREAAQRFAGQPFGHESLQSLLLKPSWQVEIVRELRRDDFDPPPRVESVMLWLASRDRPLIPRHDFAAYRRFVADCFGRHGRTVQRCVRGHITKTQLRRLSRLLRFDPGAPPSALSFDQWLGLFRFVRWQSKGG